MKIRHIFLLCSLLVLGTACGTLRETREQRAARLQRQATQVAEAVREGNFLVSIDRMIPHTGAVRQVSQYSVKVEDNVITSYLPYFGQARKASFNGGNGEYHEIEMESFGTIPLCGDALFTCDALPELNVAVDLGDGIQSIWSDTTRHARAGAQIVCQMASFPATVTSTQDAELLAKASSRHLNAGLVLAAPGKGESSTDEVYSGLCLVAEAGKVLAQDEQIGAARTSLAVSEIDVQLLTDLRRASGEYDMVDEDYTSFAWGEEPADTALTRHYNKHPHLPEDPKDLPAYCERMLDIQVSGLVKRMEYAGLTHCVVGISGGVDSTLAVMVSAMAVKRMGLPATNVVACTLPCFGTSSRTKSSPPPTWWPAPSPASAPPAAPSPTPSWWPSSGAATCASSTSARASTSTLTISATPMTTTPLPSRTPRRGSAPRCSWILPTRSTGLMLAPRILASTSTAGAPITEITPACTT